MGEPRPFDPLASGAYLVFRSELASQIETIERELASGEPVSPEVGAKLGAIFHTVKGGGGFFGLTELVGVADRLERLFLEECRYGGEEVQALFRRLCEHAKTLPEPTRGDARCPIS